MERTFVKRFKKIRRNFAIIKNSRIRFEGDMLHAGKKLQKYLVGWILPVLLVSLLNPPMPAFATAPSDVQLTYMDKEQTLQVTIAHKSYLPSFHYIKKVEIQKNSEKPLVYEYKSQPNEATFTYTYKIPLKESDHVEAKAVCNLFGSRSSSLIVAKPATKQETNNKSP